MRLADLTAEQLDRIRVLRYDRLVEKHEGPWDWTYQLDDDPTNEDDPRDKHGRTDILTLGGYHLLLPVGRKRHPNITLVRAMPSADGDAITVFFTDTTFCPDPKDAWYCAGHFAICVRFPDTDLFVARVYHEWLMTELAIP